MPTPVSETPLFFTASDRPLYGVFHAAARAREGAPVVVHCHALGVEQMVTTRTEVTLARAAAAARFPAFRFHARGHGDSSGDFADVTLDGVVDDALAAAAEARAQANAAGVVWLGFRFGALVAAEAARRSGGAALALWEPVHRPAEWARSLLRGLILSQVAQGRRPDFTVDQLLERLERDGRVDVQGYYLHRTVLATAGDRDLAAILSDWRGPTLLGQVQARRQLSPANAALAEQLTRQGAAVRAALVHEEPGWSYSSNPPWVATELVRQTVEWLDALA